MGNSGSSYGPVKSHELARHADCMKLNIRKLINLRDSCFNSSRRGRTTVDRRRLNLAMENVGIKGRYEAAMFSYIFSMWDNGHSGEIDILVFCVGLSPLACTSEDSISTYITAALKVLDVADSKQITRANAMAMLSAVMVTASFFGEKILSSAEIQMTVNDVFGRFRQNLSHHDFAKRLTQHPKIYKFATSKGFHSVKPENLFSSCRVLEPKEKRCHPSFIRNVTNNGLFEI